MVLPEVIRNEVEDKFNDLVFATGATPDEFRQFAYDIANHAYELGRSEGQAKGVSDE